MVQFKRAEPFGLTFSPNSNKNNQNRRRRRRNNSSSRIRQIPVTRSAIVSASVPRSVTTSYPFRRSWQQLIAYNPTLGWASAGSSNLQVSYALGSSDVRIGGVSIYVPGTPNVAEITSLFDQYKILRVTTRLDWSMNAYSPSADQTQALPIFYYVVDHDDSNDGTVADLLQYSGVGTHSFLTGGYKPLIITQTPRPLRDVASTGIATGYSPMERNPFIRTTEANVPHYGLKIALQNMGATVNANIGQLLMTTYIDFVAITPK